MEGGRGNQRSNNQESSTCQQPLNKCGMSGAALSKDCFDCNICLDFAADPVVTLCGHLYCWPCIYRWLQQSPGDSPQQCPVCKAALLQQTLVPLYGRGQSTTACQQHNFDIPRRPSFEWETIQRQLIQSSGETQNPGVRPPPQHRVLDYPRIDNSFPSPTLGGAWLMQSTSGELLRGMTGNAAVDVQGSGVGEGAQLEPIPLGGEWWEPKGEAAGDGDGEVAPPDLGLPFLLSHSVPLFLLREQPLVVERNR